MPHDLRRAVYGAMDARCTTCATCGALWWCPEPPPGGAGLSPRECQRDKGLSAGFAWVEGVSDAALDAINAPLIKMGMGMRAAEFRALRGLEVT